MPPVQQVEKFSSFYQNDGNFFSMFCMPWRGNAIRRPAITWWRHQMEAFSALLAICAGNSPVPGEFPTQRPVTRGFDVYFDLRLNKRLSKQSWRWWFEMQSHPLWRHRNETISNYNDDAELRWHCWQMLGWLFQFNMQWPVFCIHMHFIEKNVYFTLNFEVCP